MSIVNFDNELFALVITCPGVVQHTVVSSLDHMGGTFSGGNFSWGGDPSIIPCIGKDAIHKTDYTH